MGVGISSVHSTTDVTVATRTRRRLGHTPRERRRDGDTTYVAPQHDRWLQLQSSAGNRAVTSMVRAERSEALTRAERGSAARAEEPAPTDEHGFPTEPDWTKPIVDENDREEDDLEDERAENGGAAAPAPAPAPAAAPAAPIVYPAYRNMRYNETVLAEAWTAWKETLRAANAAGRREQGFWIQWDTTTQNNATGTFRAVGHATGPVVAPGAGATINLGTKPADAGDWHTVGSFHTHTPTRFRRVGRVVGPSGADVNADTADNVAGLVYDYTEVRNSAVPAGHPVWSDARIYHSGPNRRT